MRRNDSWCGWPDAIAMMSGVSARAVQRERKGANWKKTQEAGPAMGTEQTDPNRDEASPGVGAQAANRPNDGRQGPARKRRSAA